MWLMMVHYRSFIINPYYFYHEIQHYSRCLCIRIDRYVLPLYVVTYKGVELHGVGTQCLLLVCKVILTLDCSMLEFQS